VQKHPFVHCLISMECICTSLNDFTSLCKETGTW